MSRSVWAVFLAAILGLVGVGGTPRPLGAASSGTVSVKLSDIPVGKVIQVGQMKFVKVGADQYQAINLCPTGSTYMAAYKGCVVKQTDFAYTGGEQTFKAPASGYYVLEVWGASGGSCIDYNSNTWPGGKGGYAIGAVDLKETANLHIFVGGTGSNPGRVAKISGGGYNGGGNSGSNGNYNCAGGGGMTHISTTSNVATTTSWSSAGTLIVAGGGGSPDHPDAGGNGGGMNGSDPYVYSYKDYERDWSGLVLSGFAGTQTSGNAQGYGASSTSTSDIGGGGGGWWGGKISTHSTRGFNAGGGGSGYIGSSNLVSLTGFTKHMTCYECTTSTAASTYTISNTCVNANPVMDCSKTGNGAVRITQLSVYLGI